MNLPHLYPYKIDPLGDAALLISFGNTIDPLLNRYVHQVCAALQQRQLLGVTDIIPAFASVTVLYDPLCFRYKKQLHQTFFDWIVAEVEAVFHAPLPENAAESTLITIPVCYDSTLGNDLELVQQQTGRSPTNIAEIHAGKRYQVYMLGFLPGFAYLGEVDERIAIGRKSVPVPVKAGAVAIAGQQTGIYPAASPGGWHVIGYTPLMLFNPEKDPPVLLQPGNEVQFVAIPLDEYILMKEAGQ